MKVLPTKRLIHAPLPFRTKDNFLTFPLCAKCASLSRQTQCRHSDNERAWWGTYTTFEANMAFEYGFVPLAVYEVWQFDKSEKYDPNVPNSGLFTNMVNTLYKLKLQASGYPAGCDTDEQKTAYVKSIKKHEHIDLDVDKIEDNPPQRATSKVHTCVSFILFTYYITFSYL